ncbi:MAG: protease modulator HflC [Candidatus Omnitrophica bacterium]|nr:protease modulator HflC [Candidatus Omnitrophota bacterium]
MRQVIIMIIVLIAIIILFGISGAFYTVNETQQVVVTQFGQPIGQPITKSGLKFKLPFIQQVNYFEKRILEWDGEPNQIPTKDKKYILVDTTARWKIKDALKFLQSVGNETGGQARLDDILDSATRDAVTNQNLVEAVRNTNRIIEEKTTPEDDSMGQVEELEKIEQGRELLTRAILEEASKIVPQYGIELIDIRIKRINYVADVQEKVFERMISERKRAAEQYRSEGQGKKAEIEGKRAKELNQIESDAYRVAEELKGKADAEATNIYAQAYNKSPEFYAFLKTLETYKNTIDKSTTLILTTDSEYLQYLQRSEQNPQ